MIEKNNLGGEVLGKSEPEGSPAISVVLPVYNGEKYIAEAIESILCQTFSDFELIVIDDGSTDGTGKILLEYRDRDSRVRLVSRENKGLIATLNEGAALSRGKWLARMDSDDVALPQRFERQLEWLAKTSADICGSWVQRFGGIDNRIVKLPQTDDAIKKAMLFSSPFAHPSIIMRTSLVQQLRYDTAWKTAEDYDLWVRAIEAGFAMTNVPEVLLMYRVHENQVSTHSVHFQQQQGQEIRRRYWHFVFNSMGLERAFIDDALLIFVQSLSKVNMDIADALFVELLQKSNEASREVIFPQITRLYIMVAANCPDIVSRWERLAKEAGMQRSCMIRIKLSIFRLLRIRENSFLFNMIKKFYLWRR